MTAVTDRDRNRPVEAEKQVVPQSPGELIRIPLTQLVESPWNPRKHFDPVKLAEMVDSLKKGQLAPIIVRPTLKQRLAERSNKPETSPDTALYEIGAGHRRYRAAPAAGLTSLLAIVRDLDDVAFLEAAAEKTVKAAGAVKAKKAEKKPAKKKAKKGAGE